MPSDPWSPLCTLSDHLRLKSKSFLAPEIAFPAARAARPAVRSLDTCPGTGPFTVVLGFRGFLCCCLIAALLSMVSFDRTKEIYITLWNCLVEWWAIRGGAVGTWDRGSCIGALLLLAEGMKYLFRTTVEG